MIPLYPQPYATRPLLKATGRKTVEGVGTPLFVATKHLDVTIETKERAFSALFSAYTENVTIENIWTRSARPMIKTQAMGVRT